MTTPSRRGVVTVGSINIDLVVQTERRPLAGETFPGRSFAIYVGGKGANQAVQAALSGAPSYMVARSGADVFAPLVRDLFDRTGVDRSFVFEDPIGTGIGHVVVDDRGDYSTIIVAQANGNLTPADIERAEPAFASSIVLLLQLETPLTTVKYAAAKAREMGVRVCLNAAPALAIGPDLLDLVDLLVVNEVEAQMLLGLAEPLRTAEAVQQAARALAGGRREVVITLGERGAYALDAKRDELIIGAHHVDVVNTIGAGDAFVGELAAQVAAGKPLEAALPYASAAAALAVMRSEPQGRTPQREEIELLIHGGWPPVKAAAQSEAATHEVRMG